MIIRNCIVIPCFNNAQTIAGVVADCLDKTKFPILVVDDGSDILVEHLISKYFESKRLFILRHEKNEGKGQALQTAIRWAVKQGFTHITSIDADGQHFAKDILPLIAKVKENPMALVIGSRKFTTQGNVPAISKFGRKFSNFWVNYQSGVAIKDSQSGFRIYPLFFLQTTNFYTKRYDFEIEVLVRCLWKNVSVVEVEIDVFYPTKDERVSHFKKFYDNFRISLLNTVLVVLLLFRMRQTPFKTAMGISIGVFVGCTPFFGLHALMVIPIALFLKLSYPLLLLGTQISIPPMIPILVPSSMWLGSRINGKNFEFNLAQWDFKTYLVGSLALGTILALISGILIFTIMYFIAKKKSKNWNGKIRGGVGNNILIYFMKKFGRKPIYFFLKILVPYFIIFAPKARRASHEYWKILYPFEGYLKRSKRVINHFHTFGKILVDRIYQSFYIKSVDETELEGHDLLFKGNGALILLGAHFGAWDLSSFYMNSFNLNRKLHLVQLRADSDDLKKMLKHEDNTRSNIKFINPLNNAALEITKVLKEGELVGVLGDRVTGSGVELVPFLGKLAFFDTNMFRLSQFMRVPISYSLSARMTDGKYFFSCSPTNIVTKGQVPEIDVYNSMQSYARELEKFIGKYPEQWLNFYSYWSTLPETMIGLSNKSRNHLLEELDKQTSNQSA